MQGGLTFYYSTMNAGKSTQLLQNVYNYQNVGVNCLLMTSSKDTRSGKGVIKSRLGIEQTAIAIHDTDDLYNKIIQLNYNQIVPYKVVFIDESQFLTKKHVDSLAKLADTHGLEIKCYGLKTSYSTELFEGSKRLLEISDKIIELESICVDCGSKAIYNIRTIDSDDEIVIGDIDIYKTLCRKCYHKHIIKNTQ